MLIALALLLVQDGSLQEEIREHAGRTLAIQGTHRIPEAIVVGRLTTLRGPAVIEGAGVRVENGSLENVTVPSLELSGACFLKNVTVQGTLTASGEVVAERLKCAGIRNVKGGLYIRDLQAGQVVNDSGRMVILDGRVEGVENSGALYVRGVEGVSSSHDWKRFTGGPVGSLRLGIRETPASGDAISVLDDGITSNDSSDDDAVAIQRAVDAGRGAVVLPYGTYHVRTPIVLRGSVNRLDGSGSTILLAPGHRYPERGYTLPIFRIEGGKTDHVILEGFHVRAAERSWAPPVPGAVGILHASWRPLVLKNIRFDGSIPYEPKPGAGHVFGENVSIPRLRFTQGQRAWFRALTVGGDQGPLIRNEGAEVWILGLRSETHVTVVETRDGGSTEILGASLHATTEVARSVPLLRTVGARFSIAPFGTRGNWQTQSEEIAGKEKIQGGDVSPFYCSVPGTGLAAEYFQGIGFDAHKLDRVDGGVDFEWGEGSPDGKLQPERFSVRWTGRVTPRFSDEYTFHTLTDDGVRLWVDGRRLIDNWTDHGPTEDKGKIRLRAGRAYRIRMEFYENGGGATARLFWSSKRQKRQIVPKFYLSPEGD